MRRGFTLIELSIALVIIGLIAGGILLGRDLVRTSELRSVIKEHDAITAGVNSFRNKYNCLPGDCANATNFGFTANGDGNGLIGQFALSGYGEVWQFFKQLSEAGLISGTYTGVAGANGWRHAVPGQNVMASKMNNVGYTVVNWWGWVGGGSDYTPPAGSRFVANVILIGTSHNDTVETYAPGFSAIDAYGIDSKIDDGLPATGIAIHTVPGIFPTCVTSTNAATARYNTSLAGINCDLMLQAGF